MGAVEPELTIVVNGPSGKVSVDDYLRMVGVAVAALSDTARSMRRGRQLTWNVSRLHTSEPTVLLTAEVAPTAPDNLPEVVLGSLFADLYYLERTEEAPRYLSDSTLDTLYSVSEKFDRGPVRGLTLSTGADIGKVRSVSITRETYRHLDELLNVETVSIGSITGFLATATTENGRHLTVKDEQTGRGVRCTVSDELLERAGAAITKRVIVRGTIARDNRGRPIRIEATDVERLPDPDEAPTVAEMFGAFPDFTGDLDSVEYVRRMRDRQ